MKEKSKKSGGIVRIVLIVFVSIVIGFTVYNFNAKSLMGNAMPMPFGVGVGMVMSGSMEPRISKGDLIVVKQQDSYKLYDIVVFQQNGILVVHEIISIDGNTVITKGDANPSQDPPMDVKNIKGKVVSHARGLGKVVWWIKSPLGTTLILGVAIFFLVKSYRDEDKAEVTTDKQKLEQIKKQIEELKKDINKENINKQEDTNNK
ncbi:MAG: signal peptidase I [Clostridia bacterium]|nr:signal peptidase I [Clostridia bacterium]